MSKVLLLLREGDAVSTLLELDAVISEGHSFSQEVTQHPIEESSPVADHVRAKPRPLSLVGMVSNSPIAASADLTRLALQPSVGMQLAGRISSAYEKLLSLEGRTVEVVTALAVYKDMALVNLDIPRDAGIGDVLRFSCSLLQIRKVFSLTVPIVKTSTTGGQGRQNLGPQPATKAEDATTNKSLIVQGLESSDLGKDVLGWFKSIGRGE